MLPRVREKATARGREGGFSLIELMISLAIIGILATIAIPRFIVYRERAFQAEVKSNLVALRASEISFFSENNKGYTDDLSQVAWRPEGTPRYLYGFVSDGFPAASGVNDTAELAATTNVGYSTVSMVLFPGVPLTHTDLPASSVVTPNGFTAAAVGNVDDDPSLDEWTIDQNAVILHVFDDPSNG